MSMSDEASSSAAAEAEVEAVRAGLVGTLAQLRENLRPTNVVDEVVSSARIGASTLSEQAWDTARRNPLPAVLIGAGVAMLLGIGTRAATHASGSGGEVTDALPTGNAAAEPRAAGVAQAAPGVGEELARRAGDPLDDPDLHAAAARGASAFESATDSATRSDPMTSSPRNAGPSLRHLMKEQPLILGALGVALGAAIGAALPHTRAEDAFMGEASGGLRAAAKGMVHDQVEGVKAAASHAVDDMKQAAAARGVNADNLSGLVHDVGDRARSATYEAGRAIDPTT